MAGINYVFVVFIEMVEDQPGSGSDPGISKPAAEKWALGAGVDPSRKL